MFDKVSPCTVSPSVCLSVSASIPMESSWQLIIEHAPGKKIEGRREKNPFSKCFAPAFMQSLYVSVYLYFCLLCLVIKMFKYLCWHFTFYILAISHDWCYNPGLMTMSAAVKYRLSSYISSITDDKRGDKSSQNTMKEDNTFLNWKELWRHKERSVNQQTVVIT